MRSFTTHLIAPAEIRPKIFREEMIFRRVNRELRMTNRAAAFLPCAVCLLVLFAMMMHHRLEIKKITEAHENELKHLEENIETRLRELLEKHQDINHRIVKAKAKSGKKKKA